MWWLGPAIRGSSGPACPPFSVEVGTALPDLWYRLASDANSGSAAGVAAVSNVTLNLTGAGAVPGGRAGAFGGASNPGRVVGSTTNYVDACTIAVLVTPEASGHGTDGLCHLAIKGNYPASTPTDFPLVLAYIPATRRVEFRISPGTTFFTFTTLQTQPLTSGTTYMIHATYNAQGQCALYVNGELVASTFITFTVPTTGFPWSFGHPTLNGVAASTTAFNGRLSELAVYPRALTPTEVALQGYAARGQCYFATPDPLLNYRTLFLQFDGNNNSSAFVDSGPLNLPITAAPFDAQPVQRHHPKVFGVGSLRKESNGAVLNIPDNPAMRFGTGDFTLSMFVRPDSFSVPRAIFGKDWNFGLSWPAWGIQLTASGHVGFEIATTLTGGIGVYSPTPLTLGKWSHIEASRAAGIMYLFVDGQLVGTAACNHNITYGDTSSANRLTVGSAILLSGTSGFHGNLDHLEVLSGAARHTAPFIVPTGPY